MGTYGGKNFVKFMHMFSELANKIPFNFIFQFSIFISKRQCNSLHMSTIKIHDRLLQPLLTSNIVIVRLSAIIWWRPMGRPGAEEPFKHVSDKIRANRSVRFTETNQELGSLSLCWVRGAEHKFGKLGTSYIVAVLRQVW